MTRSRIAFLVAPLAVPIIVAGPTPWTVEFIYSALTAYAGTLAFGLPVYRCLLARKWTAFWIAPVVGFVGAGLAYFALWLIFVLPFGFSLPKLLSTLSEGHALREILWPFGPMGSLVGCLLWLIARPDQAGNSAAHRPPVP